MRGKNIQPEFVKIGSRGVVKKFLLQNKNRASASEKLLFSPERTPREYTRGKMSKSIPDTQKMKER